MDKKVNNKNSGGQSIEIGNSAYQPGDLIAPQNDSLESLSTGIVGSGGKFLVKYVLSVILGVILTCPLYVLLAGMLLGHIVVGIITTIIYVLIVCIAIRAIALRLTKGADPNFKKHFRRTILVLLGGLFVALVIIPVSFGIYWKLTGQLG
jgi:hypothetical protein